MKKQQCHMLFRYAFILTQSMNAPRVETVFENLFRKINATKRMTSNVQGTDIGSRIGRRRSLLKVICTSKNGVQGNIVEGEKTK